MEQERPVKLWARAWVEVGDDRASARDAARAWVEGAAAALPEGVWDAHLSGEVEAFWAREPFVDDILGVPGTRYALLRRNGRFRSTTALLRPRTWDRLWAHFGGRLLTDATIELGRLTPREGAPVSWSSMWMHLDPDLTEWLCLSLSVTLPTPVGWEGIDDTWAVQALWAAAQGPGIDFGVVTPAWHNVGIEAEQPASTLATIRASREVLRGYEWVTVMSDVLAARLGGADGLAATGAFSRVEALPNGGLWAQATDRFADYGPDQVAAVFEAFRPVLPDRELHRPPLDPNPWVLYDRRGAVADPASYRNNDPRAAEPGDYRG